MLHSLKQYPADNAVGHASLVFELCYPESLRIVDEQGWLWRLLDFKTDNPDTAAAFAAIRGRAAPLAERAVGVRRYSKSAISWFDNIEGLLQSQCLQPARRQTKGRRTPFTFRRIVSSYCYAIYYICLQININICLQDNDNNRKEVVNLWNIRTYEVYVEDHDFRQCDLASVLHVSQNTYSQYENGVIELTAERLVKLADFYNVSIDYLLGRTDNPEVNRN